jgi:transcriptional antiterminator NusG
MEKQWFVLHTLSGQESRVKENIERRAKLEEMGELIGDVLVPTEKVSEVKRGKKTTTTRKFYPGYVLINIQLYDEKKGLNEKSWYFIQQTSGIIGFIGGDRPVPLRKDEVTSILNQIEEKQEKVAPKVAFALGETVKINDGPFPELQRRHRGDRRRERGKLKVSVSMCSAGIRAGRTGILARWSGRNRPQEISYGKEGHSALFKLQIPGRPGQSRRRRSARRWVSRASTSWRSARSSTRPNARTQAGIDRPGGHHGLSGQVVHVLSRRVPAGLRALEKGGGHCERFGHTEPRQSRKSNQRPGSRYRQDQGKRFERQQCGSRLPDHRRNGTQHGC